MYVVQRKHGLFYFAHYCGRGLEPMLGDLVTFFSQGYSGNQRLVLYAAQLPAERRAMLVKEYKRPLQRLTSE